MFKVWASISTKLWSQIVKSINKLRAFKTFLKAHSEHWNDFSFDVSNHCEVLKQSTSKFSANRLENYLVSLWLQEEKREELLIVMTSFSYRSKQTTASLKMKVMNLLRRRTPSTGITKSLTAAQVFIFFAGGFEAKSTLMMMCSWEYAMNQGLQKALRQEFDDEVATLVRRQVYNETLNQMKLLDIVLNGTFCKWS